MQMALLKFLKSVLGHTSWRATGVSPLEPVFFKEIADESAEVWTRVHVQDKGDCHVQDATNPDKNVIGDVEAIETEQGAPRKHCTWMETAWVHDAKAQTLQSNEYFHELAVSYLVKEHLADVPAFAASSLAGASYKAGGCGFEQLMHGNVKRHSKRSNNMYFKSVGSARDFEDVINDLSYEQWHSIIAQTLVSIRLGQHRIQLKHHDMHLGNVLLTPTTPTLTHWTIATPEGEVSVPMRGIQAVLIDFGLSSAVDPDSKLHCSRVDEVLLLNAGKHDDSDSDMSDSDSGSEDSWGVWGSKLEGDEGYDVAMFVESMVEKLFEERPLNVRKLTLISKLQELVNVDFTDRGRPAEHSTVDWKAVFNVLDVLNA